MSKAISPEDAAVVSRIIEDSLARLDALTERRAYDSEVMLRTMLGGVAAMILWRTGCCRTDLVRWLNEGLAGRCNCEIETKGNA